MADQPRGTAGAATGPYLGSPLAALSSVLEGRLEPGRIGLVMAPTGVGKSTLLVHVALHALIEDRAVLHVALRDTVDHARAHYDEVVRSVAARTRQRDEASLLVSAERHRMIHSFAGRPFDLDALRRNLRVLSEAAQFVPSLLVIDGFEVQGLQASLPALSALVEELAIPCWISVRTDQPLPSEVWARCAVGLRLVAEGGTVRLALAHTVGEPVDLDLKLDPTTMLVLGGDEEPDQTSTRPHAATDCTLYSGGAAGAEAFFGEQAERHGVREVAFTFDGHLQERSRGRYELSPRELAAGDVSLLYVSKRLNRTYSDRSGLIRGVLQTLWHMVSRSQQVFVVGLIQDDGTVKGGTGWSVELARMWSRELWVFDQERASWFGWDGQDWTPGTPRITTTHFTGTGTRYLSEEGRQAIAALYERSFGEG